MKRITESYAVLRMLVVFSENQEVSFGSSLLKVSRKLYIFGIEKKTQITEENYLLSRRISLS